jgi:PhnB protein
MATVNPYLNFSGTCMQAFDFYKSVFGGEFSNVSRFSEMPSDEPADPALADQIMHIALPLGDSVLMGSDVPPEMGTVTPGNNTYVTVTPDSVADAERIFTALAEDGDIEMPFDKQFWGDYFGSCTDRFGIHWMVDVADEEQPTTS